MKRLIALSIAFALVLTSAFAEVTVGGSVLDGWAIVSGTNIDDDKIRSNDGITDGDINYPFHNGRARINITAVNDDGNLGAWAQLRPGKDYGALANIWWQPISMIKFTLGYVWGAYGPGVGVTSIDSDLFAAPIIRLYGRNGWKGDNRKGAMNAWGYEVTSGASVELFPMDNFYVIVTVPTGDAVGGILGVDKDWDGILDIPPGDTATHLFAGTMARIAYNIDGIGYISATFAGGEGKINDSNRIHVGFNLTAVENLGAWIGFEAPLPEKTGDNKKQSPMEINARASFKAGAFNVNGGVFFTFLGSTQNSGADKVDTPLTVGATLNPTYDLGIVMVGLVGELKFTAEQKDTRDSNIEWNVFPYLQKNVGGGAVYGGFQVGSLNTPKFGGKGWETNIMWSVPVGFEYWF